MADNVAVTAGTGTSIAADEVIDGTLGTVKVGFGKIMDGTLDSTNKLVVDASGALSNNTTKIGSTAVDTNSGLKSAGTQRIVLATDQPALTNALKVDGSAVTQPVSGTVTATTGLTTADLDLGVGTDTRAVVGLVGSKSGGGVLIPGDATKGLAVDLTATGANTTALKVDGSAVTQPVSLTSTTVTGTVAVTESGTWNVGSSTATGSAVPANAMYAGVNARTALPTAATAGNLTGVSSDKFGRVIALSGTIRDLVGTQTTTIAASTAETTIVTAAASTFNDLTALVVSNTSATAARLDFRDTTAGSILFSLYIPAGDVRGVAFQRPVPQTTVNTNWTAQSSVSVTDLRVYAVFDKNA